MRFANSALFFIAQTLARISVYLGITIAGTTIKLLARHTRISGYLILSLICLVLHKPFSVGLRFLLVFLVFSQPSMDFTAFVLQKFDSPWQH